MVVCKSCGEENPERARFCLACGNALEAAARAGEERKVVSVVFVDLVGFTSRSDRADPEDVRATLRPYHEGVKADIERYGGTVEKFIGDAVMAVFGAPVAHEDDAERAVRSALRILDTIEELREGGLDIAVRAAVTTGESVVALGARPERGEGIVTGDVVNTAARLQSAAPVGSVIVDEATMHTTERSIAYELLESVEAKGKAEPIRVWRAIEARSRVGQPEAATHTPFVGREHERTLLLETFLRSERESSVQLVTVVGEPGIGKSRLATELRTALDDRPEVITWRHGRCLPYGERITFWALGEIVKSEAGILESDDHGAARGKLSVAVVRLFPDTDEATWVEARLAPLVGAESEGVASTGREESFTAWRRFLEELAARRPCVLVVEDLHWADDALLDFLEHLLDWSAPVPLFLLCTARPELFERRPAWGGGKRNATTISLSPLTNEDASRLLQALLERSVLAAETQTLLLERAGGNPLYAEQFARMLAERDDADGVAVPETVHALVAARLDTLRPELKSLLHDAAVVGRVFWLGAVASIAARERDVVRRDLNELVRREFVRPIRVSSIEGEDELSFWHALVRDVAYQQIPRAPRAEKHVGAARWVEEIAGERQEDHAGILVYHYGEAHALAAAAGVAQPDVEERLWNALLLAGDRAAQLDLEAAERYFRRAVELAGDRSAERAAALAKLAYVLATRGQAEEAVAVYEEAIPVLLETDEIAAGEALRRLSTTSWALGEAERSRASAREAIEVLTRHPGPELVRAYGSAALTDAIAGRFGQAQELITAGFELASRLGVDDVGVLLHARASSRGYQGDARCIDDVRAARDLGLRLGRGRDTSISMNNLADGEAWYLGLRQARETWEQAIQFSRERGITAAEMWQRGERLRCLYHAGEWDDALAEAAEVLQWDLESGAGPLEVYARLPMASIHVHRGDLAEAQAQAAALLPAARRSGDPQVLVPGLSIAALVASAVGETERVLQYLADLDEATKGLVTFRSFCLAEPFRIAVAAGAIDLATSFLGDSQHTSAFDSAARAGAEALVAEAQGSTEVAARLFREAATRWNEYGSVVEQGYSLLGLGRCGDGDAVLEANAIFERLGARPVLARAA
jgi:class 3 adenylate cyclase/tetratricopeptide (TPR) repeat protein